MTVTLIQGDCRDVLKMLPAESVHCALTSPPYFGLRDYGHNLQIGLESTPAKFVEELVGVFRELRRVLRDDGTLWVIIGDSYSHGGCGSRDATKWPKQSRNDHMKKHQKTKTGLRPKSLLGIPWRLAFAMQDDGWILRQDIIWNKPNAMPESVKDRCTRSHEYIFMFSKGDRYYFDHEAIKEPSVSDHQSGNDRSWTNVGGRRNKRSVWTISTKPFRGAHFATFPPDLIEPCILASTSIGGTVLDPFYGSGTTGLVAQKTGRNCIGIELNSDYVAIAESRTPRDPNKTVYEMFLEALLT